MRGDQDASFSKILKNIFSGWNKSHSLGTFPNLTSCVDGYHRTLPGHPLALLGAGDSFKTFTQCQVM